MSGESLADERLAEWEAELAECEMFSGVVVAQLITEVVR